MSCWLLLFKNRIAGIISGLHDWTREQNMMYVPTAERWIDFRFTGLVSEPRLGIAQAGSEGP